MTEEVRVRFAPSPTGSLHLGNALSAVANRTFADEHGGALVLRIDDTDPARNVEGGEEQILADLDWIGVGWDEGPVRQSERAEIYAEAAAQALEHGAVEDAEGAIRLEERRSHAPTALPRTSWRPSRTTSRSASPTSSAAPTTGRTRSCTAGSRLLWVVSCPR